MELGEGRSSKVQRCERHALEGSICGIPNLSLSSYRNSFSLLHFVVLAERRDGFGLALTMRRRHTRVQSRLVQPRQLVMRALWFVPGGLLIIFFILFALEIFC